MKDVSRMSIADMGEFVDLASRLEKHMEKDEEYQKAATEKLEIYHQQNTDKLDKILNNHLNHMEIDMAVLKNQVGVLLGIVKVVGSFILITVLGALLSTVILK